MVSYAHTSKHVVLNNRDSLKTAPCELCLTLSTVYTVLIVCLVKLCSSQLLFSQSKSLFYAIVLMYRDPHCECVLRVQEALYLCFLHLHRCWHQLSSPAVVSLLPHDLYVRLHGAKAVRWRVTRNPRTLQENMPLENPRGWNVWSSMGI